jgi:hypothetical protein
MKIIKIKNSNKFREPILRFIENGRYSPYPDGTLADLNYWIEEQNRSIHGYTAPDGDWISGYNYFYLNYCQIERLVRREIKYGKHAGEFTEERETFFPDFYDYDYNYFLMCDEAEKSNKHMVVLKKRGSGYSFKAAAMLCRNYFCIEKSKSYAVAATTEFLLKDGILTKAWDIIDFIDTHTGFAKRRDKSNSKLERVASYIETDEYGRKIEKGYKSAIIGISTGDSTGTVRGKRGKLYILEEAGSFADITTVWNTIRPSVEDGGRTFGLIVAQGTGGDKDSKFAGLKKMFYDPDSFNVLPIENSWDEGLEGQKCCFFVPEYANLSTLDKNGVRLFMDEDGNTMERPAIDFVINRRSEIKDQEMLDKYIAEHPLTPQESMLDYGGNIFPKKQLMSHLSSILSNKKLSHHKQVGELDYIGGVLQWNITKGGDVTEYPLREGMDKRGSIVIWEHPDKEPPNGLYIGGIDPYDFDTANYSSSLGSMIIYKRFQDFESYYDLPVAEYTGRPGVANDFYENCRKLALYYNAKVLYENEKKGLHTYFSQKHSDYILADQPDILSDIVKGSKVNRKKGIHMSTPIIDWSIGRVNEWLREEFSPGHMNLEKIFSVPLLQELIAYNPKGNFDRVRAFQCVMLLREQMHNRIVKDNKAEDRAQTLFEAPFFVQNKF